MAGLEIRTSEEDAVLADAHEIRRRVFIEEQGVSEALEMDDKDGESVHLVAYDDDEPVGTARLRDVGEGTGKVERVAVRREARERGIGRQVMDRTHDVARERGLDRIVVHSQTAVEEFYHALGYRTTSDVFREADIPHVEMEREL